MNRFTFNDLKRNNKMNESTKNILLSLFSGAGFVNNTDAIIELTLPISNTLTTKVTALIDLITSESGVPDPVTLDLVVPVNEQAYIDQLNLLLEYQDKTIVACNDINIHIDSVIDSYSDTIGLNKLGAEVLDETLGGGTALFRTAYALTATEGLILIAAANEELSSMAEMLPSTYAESLIVGQTSALIGILAAATDYKTIVTERKAVENSAIKQLISAAKKYVLAVQVESWVTEDITAELVTGTASSGLMGVLES